MTSPLRLSIDLAALTANWRWFAAQSGRAACGAAVKADGYGLGARGVVDALAKAGCRDFFVASWDEARALHPIAEGLSVKVLHGVLPQDMRAALHSRAAPVLSTPLQVVRWREAAPGKPCDLMVDTGMNRLGLSVKDASSPLVADLAIDTLHSHLASADEPGSSQNAAQREAFLSVPTTAPRRALANSAGICLGNDYHFDLTRPGLGLYGGIPHPAAKGHVTRVVTPQAQLVQVRDLKAGDSIGYGATFTAPRPMRIAVLNVGYADGYLRAFSDKGHAVIDGTRAPVLGRVSMDLTVIDIGATPSLLEGDWIDIGYDLPEEAAISGLTQYELLTALGPRYQRRYA